MMKPEPEQCAACELQQGERIEGVEVFDPATERTWFCTTVVIIGEPVADKEPS